MFESDLRSILTDLNGHWDRLEDWMWQPAYTPAPDEPSETLTPPAQFSNGLHVDGRRAIGGPGAVYCDEAQTMSIKPFQNFVFVSVSDLRPLGHGQTHVLPQAHIAMEEFFNWQQATHGEVGSLGPGWNIEADPVLGLEPARHGDLFKDKGGHRGIPDMVRGYFASREDSSLVGANGERVPKPVPITLGPGDACIGAPLPSHPLRPCPLDLTLYGSVQPTSRFPMPAPRTTAAPSASRPSSASSFLASANRSLVLSRSGTRRRRCRCPWMRLSSGARTSPTSGAALSPFLRPPLCGFR